MEASSYLKDLSDEDLLRAIWETQDRDLLEHFEALKVIFDRAWIPNDDEGALAWTERMLEVGEKLESQEKIAYALHHMGMAHHVLNNFDESIQHLQSSEEIYKNIGDYESQCRVILQLADVFDTMEMYDEKIAQLERARELAVSEEFISLAGEACNAIAIYLFLDAESNNEHFETANENYALEMALDAIRFYTNAGDLKGVATGQLIASKVLNHLGREKEALEFAEEAFEYWVNVPDFEKALSEVGECALQIGIVLHDLGQYDEAKEDLATSLEAFQAANEVVNSARAHLWMGKVNEGADEYEEAIASYKSVLALLESDHKSSNGEWVFFRAQQGIAQCLWFQDKNQESFDWIDRIVAANFENDSFRSEFLTKFILTAASAAHDLEDWLKVLATLDRLPIDLVLQISPADSIRFDGLKASALLKTGNFEAALAIANTVIESVKDEELLAIVGLCYEVRAEILEESNKQAALSDYVAAQAIYLENGHFAKAQRTALKLIPKAQDRTRINPSSN